MEIKDKIKIAIIEDHKELCRTIQHHLNMQEDFEVVGVTHDGKEGLKLLKNTEVDVALIDIILPLLDGMAVLEGLKDFEKKPVFIMLTAVSHEAITQKALALGADYFILKPFDMALLIRRIKEIYEYKNTKALKKPSEEIIEAAKSVDEIISNVLHKVGIASNLNGYAYLKTAISLAYKDRSMLEGITKVLYPTVAKKCNVSSVRVERSIRHAIESSWEKGNHSAYQECLGYFSPENTKPTNSNFICLAIEHYERYLEKECCGNFVI